MKPVPGVSVRKQNVFRNGHYRQKGRDAEAVVVTKENAKELAIFCAGTVMELDDTIGERRVMIRFQGLHDMEVVFEGEYLMRTIMPGEEYWSALTKAAMADTYEKISKKESE